MLNSKELSSLLVKGKALQEEISAFIQKPRVITPSSQLKKDIDDLITQIQKQLPNPSDTENSETTSVITTLGSIRHTFNKIKPMLQNNNLKFTLSFTFFKPQPNSQLELKLQLLHDQLVSNLNQLEKSLDKHSRISPALGG